jgi:hypothetical protein
MGKHFGETKSQKPDLLQSVSVPRANTDNGFDRAPKRAVDIFCRTAYSAATV